MLSIEPQEACDNLMYGCSDHAKPDGLFKNTKASSLNQNYKLIKILIKLEFMFLI